MLDPPPVITEALIFNLSPMVEVAHHTITRDDRESQQPLTRPTWIFWTPDSFFCFTLIV